YLQRRNRELLSFAAIHSAAPECSFRIISVSDRSAITGEGQILGRNVWQVRLERPPFRVIPGQLSTSNRADRKDPFAVPADHGRGVIHTPRGQWNRVGTAAQDPWLLHALPKLRAAITPGLEAPTPPHAPRQQIALARRLRRLPPQEGDSPLCIPRAALTVPVPLAASAFSAANYPCRI